MVILNKYLTRFFKSVKIFSIKTKRDKDVLLTDKIKLVKEMSTITDFLFCSQN